MKTSLGRKRLKMPPRTFTCKKNNNIGAITSRLKARTANMGFGGMAALRIYPDRYNIPQRHIQPTNKAQL